MQQQRIAALQRGCLTMGHEFYPSRSKVLAKAPANRAKWQNSLEKTAG
jgi:hypothetical protein